MNIAIVDIILAFFICAFLGWILECSYKSIKERRWVNSGMLKGPLCPIYGFGGIFTLFFNQLLFSQSNYQGYVLVIMQFIVFSLSMTLIEYIGGLALLDKKDMRLWDYSNEPCQYKGLVCLRFSIYWGIAALVMVYYIQPLMVDMIALHSYHEKIVYAILLSSYILYATGNALGIDRHKRI